ncbi:MAG TPA: hypothetical protein VK541_05045 [Pedobacter sp.]|uniref:hypothetical protein n=1 Tax=Pedobacter sp. TaxID=1411316 RepID=UPI002C55436D|nr:hypothetical protein [Pedobacter sp.]HMI01826.1 hypothetical protein [Pedobacter sp.]
MKLQLQTHSGYPMYFTRRTQQIEQNKVQAIFKADTAPVAANEITGTAIMTIAVETPLVVGQEFNFAREDHVLLEILEERPAKGKHIVEGGGYIIYQKIKSEFTVLSPIV